MWVTSTVSPIPYVEDDSVKVNVYRTVDQYAVVEAYIMEVGFRIDHCNVHSSSNTTKIFRRRLEFRLAVGEVVTKRKGGRKFLVRYCFSQNLRWVQETDLGKCHKFSNPVILMAVDKIKSNEVIALVCVAPSSEFIIELLVDNYPRLQVQMPPGHVFQRTSKNLYLPLGSTVICVSSITHDVNIGWQRIVGLKGVDFSRGQTLHIDLAISNGTVLDSSIEKQFNEYECGLIYLEKLKMAKIKVAFYVQVHYISSVVDEVTNVNRTQYDSGEKVTCTSTSRIKLSSYDIWWPPILIERLVDPRSAEKYMYMTSINEESMQIKVPDIWKPPVYLRLQCLIITQSNAEYILWNEKITILTTDITNVTSVPNNPKNPNHWKIRCNNVGLSIYMYRSILKNLPLSKSISSFTLLTPEDNKTVTFTLNYSMDFNYYVVCVKANFELTTPLLLNFKAAQILRMTMVRPPFAEIPKYQIKGFQFRCWTPHVDYAPRWHCSNCRNIDIQLVTEKNSSESLLELLGLQEGQEILIIRYECQALRKRMVPNSNFSSVVVTVIQLPLIIIDGPRVRMAVRQPNFFFVPGQLVQCEAFLYDQTNAYLAWVPLPTRLSYADPSAPNVQTHLSTPTKPLPNGDGLVSLTNCSSWRACLPNRNALDYRRPLRFTACCTFNPQGRPEQDSHACLRLIEIPVILNYSFKYDRRVVGAVIYPGQLIRCCLLAKYTNPKAVVNLGDERDCMPAIIKLSVNKDRNATTANLGELIYEGLQVPIPSTYGYLDITKVSTFLRCSVGIPSRDKQDTAHSVVELSIKSCLLDPPPLVMLPEKQALFLVNESISCDTLTEECRYGGIQLIFKVFRGGEIISELHDVPELRLGPEFLGDAIQVVCISGIQSQDTKTTKQSRDISVHSLPFDIQVSKVQQYMLVNSVISCSAHGFPPPSIVWTQIDGPSLLLIDDNYLILRNWDRSGLYKLRCSAINQHGNIEREITFQLVNINMRKFHFSKKYYIFMALLLFFYFVLLSFVVAFALKEYIFNVKLPYTVDT